MNRKLETRQYEEADRNRKKNHSRLIPTNHKIVMLTARCLSCWWLKTLPTTLSAFGYNGVLMKYRFKIRHAGGHNLHKQKTVRFAPMIPITVAAAGGTSGQRRFSLVGGW
jgi:hypothetical protein